MPQLPAHWYSFHQPQDDMQSQPHLVLIHWPTVAQTQDSDPKPAIRTAKPTAGFSSLFITFQCTLPITPPPSFLLLYGSSVYSGKHKDMVIIYALISPAKRTF